jgi:large subunit ribosomal protein L11
MKKKYLTWKLQLPPGQARPGQKLAFLGKNAMKFCREFNERTKEIESSKIVNVRVVVKENSYQFFIEGRVTSDLIKKIVGEEKETRKKEINKSEIKKIIQEKLEYLNTEDYEKAEKTVIGTVRSFSGVKIIND